MQTFLELQNDTSMSAPYQAGFVPPAPAPMQNAPQFTNLTNVPPYSQHHIPQFMIEQDQQSMESLDTSSMSDTSWQTPPPPTIMDEIVNTNSNSSSITLGSNKGRPRSQNTKQGAVRRTGGRKPNKPSNLSPEEEEKRRVRRERNKLAAARCRRRREDHTQELVDETEGLERRKQQMQNEINQLTQQREELLCLLEGHKQDCRVPGRQSPPDIKPMIANNIQQVTDLPPVTMSSIGQKRPHPLLVFTSTNPQVITTQASNNGVMYNNNNNNMMDINGLAEKIKSEPTEFYDDSEPPLKK